MVIFTDVHGRQVGVDAAKVATVEEGSANNFDRRDGLPEAFIRLRALSGGTLVYLPASMGVETATRWVDAGRRADHTVVAEPASSPDSVPAADGFGSA